MLQISTDNSGNTMGGRTTLADLAQFSFNDRDSQTMNIYQADDILRRDWRDELVDVEMEYALGVSATFKDGTKLHVAAWADCCDGSGCKHCRGY
ncbi:MAG: hypothetical protein WBL20_17140 [Sphingobium sp.]|uniref:hypothetical protein n=1 Tax=Sphingobium sp. TaxID=1912891 RepID=UPI003BAEF24F